MTIMHNAPHPGELLKEYLDGFSVTDAAKALGITRANLSRILKQVICWNIFFERVRKI